MTSIFRSCTITDPISNALTNVQDGIHADLLTVESARITLLTSSAALENGSLGSATTDLSRLFKAFGRTYPDSLGTKHPTTTDEAEASLTSAKLAVVKGRVLLKNKSNNLVSLNSLFTLLLELVTDPVTALLDFLGLPTGSLALFILDPAGTVLARDTNITALARSRNLDQNKLSLRVYWISKATANRSTQAVLKSFGLEDNEVGAALFGTSAGRLSSFVIPTPSLLSGLGLNVTEISTLLQRNIAGMEYSIDPTQVLTAVQQFLRERRPGSLLGGLNTARSGSTELVRVFDLDTNIPFRSSLIPAATAAIQGTPLEAPLAALLSVLNSSWSLLGRGLGMSKAVAPSMVKIQDAFTVLGNPSFIQALTNQALGQSGPQSMLTGFLGSMEGLSSDITAPVGLLGIAGDGANALDGGVCGVATFLSEIENLLASSSLPIEVTKALAMYKTASNLVSSISSMERFNLRNLGGLAASIGLGALQNFVNQGLSGAAGSCSDPNLSLLRSAIGSVVKVDHEPST